MTDNQHNSLAGPGILENAWNSGSVNKLLLESRVGLLAIAPDHRIIDASDSICSLLGYERKQLLHLCIEDITHPECFESEIVPIIHVSNETGIEIFEQRYITSSGKDFWGKVRREIITDESMKTAHELLYIEDINAEKALSLHNRTHHLETITNKISESVSYIDREMRYQFVNENYEKFYGVKSIDVIGKTVKDVLPAVLWEHSKEKFANAFKGQQLSFTGKMNKFSDSPLPVSVKLIPEFNEHKDVQGLFIIVSEVSNLRQAEEYLEKVNEKLRLSEKNMRHMMDSSHDVVFVTNQNGDVLYVNSRIEKVFGYKIKELLGEPIDLLIPEMFEERLKANQTVKELNTSYEYNLGVVGIAKDGTEIPIDIEIGETKYDEQHALIISVRDATDQRAAMQSSQELSGIINASGDAIFRLGVDGYIQFWSIGAEKLYGYKSEEVLGKPIEFIVEGGEKDVRKSIHAKVLSGEVINQSSAIRKHKDGSLIDVSVSIFPLKNSNGETIGTASVHRDVSKLKLLESELLHSQKMESAGKMAGGIAHDFNNILTVIQGYCALITEELTEGSDLLPYTSAIERATDRASTVTRQLLAFSRKQRIDPKVLEPKELIKELSTILIRTMGENINFSQELNSTWNIKQDPAQFEQIVLNLAMNARHAMSDGGTLKIETSDVEIQSRVFKREPGFSSFSPEPVKPGKYLLLTISDTGTGMRKEVLERIFEPFYTTKPKGEGTGLGLSVVFGMVAQNGGAIRVETCVGKGTRFLVFIPRTMSNINEDEDEVSSIATGAGQILVVEDDKDLLNLSKAILESAGYTVFTASEPAEILESDFDEQLDLILSDVIMPGLSGPHFASKWLETHPDDKFLFMSGYADESVLPFSFTSKNLVLKPFKATELIKRVQDAISEAPEGRTEFLAQLGLSESSPDITINAV